MHFNNCFRDDDLLRQIVYRGEGNSSIVVALKSSAKVIRLLKKDGKIMKSSQVHHVTQHPMRNINFIHLIMKPLTDPFLNSATELVHLKSKLVNHISRRVEAERPLHRLDKTLHLDDQYALVMDDLCALPLKLTRLIKPVDFCGPTISIEIKPKQGFLPIHRLLMKSTANEQLSAKLKCSCLYGLTQHLKLARGRIQEMSDYCPINLFSGCPVKMKNALENLLKNPQNNLRIFKDLILAYDETSQMKLSRITEDFFHHEDGKNVSRDHATQKQPSACNEDRLIELLIQCLLNEHDGHDRGELGQPSNLYNENSFSNNDGCLQHSSSNARCKRCDIIFPSPKKHKSIESGTVTLPSPTQAQPDQTSTLLVNKNNISHKLPDVCVLSSVLRAQRLDSIGAHEANYMLKWLMAEAKKSNIDILEELSKPQMPAGFGASHQLPHETKHEYYFRKVWEFLVSLTAKDCSIIITIRRLTSGKYESLIKENPNLRKHLLREHGTSCYFMFNVGIADLDQKMPLKIPRICDNLNQIFCSTKIR